MKNVFLLAVILLGIGCQTQEELPEDLLSEAQMVSVLIDIRVAEGKVGNLSAGRDSSRVLMDTLQKRIFRKHSLDSITYIKSYQYYLDHPEMYLRVNEIVLDSLKVRQKSIEDYRDN